MSEPTLLEALGGEDAVLALARAWHARVLADPVVSHAFSHGFHPDHEARLAAYLVEAMGGPPAWTGGSGRPRLGTESQVVRDHSGNGAHTVMDDRAIDCWEAALVDVGVPPDGPTARLNAALAGWFVWGTRVQMARFHADAADVPEGLVLPRWSWEPPG
ncbi:oxidoreductase [Nocardioides sp. GY 10127]|uniref:globin domain-containing protein n=1 Tax=Nocardioides sp. GY 10127 TaxID=2569762 RepID=UPI0010A8C4B1|nr:oxidoreductase [Nocardioides sp. GY 10127]TIC80787.1 oxidoreductase [Nocardioides sp. GY 10127]